MPLLGQHPKVVVKAMQKQDNKTEFSHALSPAITKSFLNFRIQLALPYLRRTEAGIVDEKFRNCGRYKGCA
jgi:hypothetical protein